jgi:pyruvate,water dikinase
MRNERGATAIDVPPGFWQREASHYPRPLTPLGSSLLLTGINQAFPKVFAEFGLLLETLEFREIGGYVYQRVKPFGVSGSGSRTLPPKAAVWLMLRLHPSFRRRTARCKEAMRSRLDRTLIDRWYAEWRPQLTADIGRWRSVDLTALFALSSERAGFDLRLVELGEEAYEQGKRHVQQPYGKMTKHPMTKE